MQPRIVEVPKQLLKNNDVLAREMRQQFTDAGVFVVSLASSPGAGISRKSVRACTRLKCQPRPERDWMRGWSCLKREEPGGNGLGWQAPFEQLAGLESCAVRTQLKAYPISNAILPASRRWMLVM